MDERQRERRLPVREAEKVVRHHHLPVAGLVNPFTYRLTVVAVDSERNTQTGWQAVWQPSASSSLDTPVRLADMQRLLELIP